MNFGSTVPSCALMVLLACSSESSTPDKTSIPTTPNTSAPGTTPSPMASSPALTSPVTAPGTSEGPAPGAGGGGPATTPTEATTPGDPTSPAEPASPAAGSAGAGGDVGSGGGGGNAGSSSTTAGGSGGQAAPESTDPPDLDGFSQLEALNRGVVAVATGNGTYVGWRLFGYEDPSTPFNVYRDGTLVNDAPISDSTNLVDTDGNEGSTYTVRAVVNGTEQANSEPASVWSDSVSGGAYITIPTEPPPGGTTPSGEAYTYTTNDASVGDVDGDGQYELIVKWDPSNSHDNSQSGYTGNVFIDAYRLSGERLWRIDLGINVRAGAHYTQFLVYDLDGDGKAEVALRTAPGARDSTGEFLRQGPAANDDDSADYRCGTSARNGVPACPGGREGLILTGPEYFTVFQGETGEELATVNFRAARGSVTDWGDDYGNRGDRFLASIAFVDDTGRPSAIMGRGMYEKTTFTAYNWRDGELSVLWSTEHNGQFGGKGAHSISIANVDDDPQQEIIGGAATFDNDGTGMCAVSWYGHGDALHVGDLVLDRPGLEVFMPYEADGVPEHAMRDARDCSILWQGGNSSGEGPGRGVAGDVDPSQPGAEVWTSRSNLLTSAGTSAGSAPGAVNFLIWWDADLSRELLDGTSITQFDGAGQGLDAQGCASNNGTKSTPTLSADILGDWREEVLFRCGNSIRVYTTSQPASNRIYTLMHDPQYRVAISWQNVEYNQPPHPSFHIGEGMAEPPRPDIHVR